MAIINKVTAFGKKRMEIVEFVSGNREVFDHYFEMAEQYNGLLAEAKDEVRAMPGGPVTVGPFRRSNAPVSVTYDPLKMRPEHLLLPGVIKAVDTKMVDAMVMAGNIPVADATVARVTTIGTAKIDGPQKIEVKL